MFEDSILEIMIKAVHKINYEKIISEQRELAGENISGDTTFGFDRAIEEKIAVYLIEQGFEGTVIGEEVQSYGGSEEKGIILIDPIDGSTNALRGLPFYASLIAYAEKKNLSEISRAVVFVPALNKLYYAVKRKGAYLVEGSSEKRLVLSDKKNFKYVIDMASAYTCTYANILSKFGKVRRLGSIGLAITFVAENLMDLVVDIGRYGRLLDVAAPFLILKEAGGKIITDLTDFNAHMTLNFIVGKNKLVDSIYREIWEYRKR